MSTKWFTRRPGERPISEEPDGSFCIVFGSGSNTPDWVELPQEIGGGKRRVESSYQSECACGKGHIVKHLRFDGGIGVAECMDKGFIWYRVDGKDGDT